MQAVVDRLEVRQNWRNWQVVQKQQKEEGQKRAMLGGKERLEQAVIDSARELLDEWDALAEAKETREEMMTEDEWREMSSEGRRRAVAFL
jgi:leucyl aminopeptidase (aminopeptidase T)